SLCFWRSTPSASTEACQPSAISISTRPLLTGFAGDRIMNGVTRLPMSPEQRNQLPLGFRRIFYRDLPPAEQNSRACRIDAYAANVVVSTALEKPVSRI